MTLTDMKVLALTLVKLCMKKRLTKQTHNML